MKVIILGLFLAFQIGVIFGMSYVKNRYSRLMNYYEELLALFGQAKSFIKD